MCQKFRTTMLFANFSSTMGAETIQKTRVSAKNQKSNNNKIIIGG
jgi:hypothetical protein